MKAVIVVDEVEFVAAIVVEEDEPRHGWNDSSLVKKTKSNKVGTIPPIL